MDQTLILKTTGGGRAVTQSLTFSADARSSYSLSVADSVNDQRVEMAIDVSAIVALYIKSDYAVTLETNDGGSPVDTAVLVADQPLIWHTSCLYTNLFATDITALFITNGSGSTATIDIEILHDSTV